MKTRILTTMLALFVLAGCACGRGYSEGERTGTVYKLSNKGLIWKTWEGEMLLGGARQTESGAVANIWAFTVLKPEIVTVVSAAQQSGQPMTARYIQWFSSGPTMDSDYELISLTPKAPIGGEKDRAP
jgi:hypothetical protein